jgi:hypothetical protein
VANFTSGTISGITDLAVADGGTGASDAATARTNLGAQQADATLTSIAALGTAADRYVYTTDVDVWAEGAITAAGRNLLDDSDAAAQRSTLGLGTMATQAANNVNINGGTIDGTAVNATTLSASGVTNLDAGTVAAPGLILESETGTGLYRIGANNHGYAVSGTKVLDISSTGLGVAGSVTASGDVGIGTTSPESFGGGFRTLEVAGSDNNSGGVFKTATSGSAGSGSTGTEMIVFTDNTAGKLNVVSSHPMEFYTANTLRMTLDASGSLIVGSPTGGGKGAGTINAVAVYDDDVLLTCYVLEQANTGVIIESLWDDRVPNRVHKEKGEDDEEVERVEVRTHEPMRKFKARLGTEYDPLNIDGYAKHWRDKGHLTSMPNEANYTAESTGAWIQKLVETVEIQAVLIEQLNQRLKALEA